MPFLCSNWIVSSSLVLQRCQSVPVDTDKFAGQNEVCIASTENSQQSEEIWSIVSGVWLPLCGARKYNPGLVFIDATNITSYFIKCAKNALYVVVEPSHTSMLLKIAELSIKIYTKMQFEE